MTIDPNLRVIALAFAQSDAFVALVQAVENAEGGPVAIIKAVQCSEPTVTTYEGAIRVVCRSAIHALADYAKAHDLEGFVQFWGNRWAPQGVANDPNGLNANWPKNVINGWENA